MTSLPTDFAPAERFSREKVLQQNKEWAAELQVRMIGDAAPVLILILNECRQIVYANKQISHYGNFESAEYYLGLRPGELMGCVHALSCDGGCGTTLFCSKCGSVRAILQGLEGLVDVEECTIDRGKTLEKFNLRVWTTPVKLNDADYVIFSIQDISLEMENKRLFAEVERLSVLDSLTGVLNRRAFFEAARREFARSIRYDHPLSTIMIDMDDFKQINDTYGHLVGDKVLKAVTSTFSMFLRDVDLLGRYGGDEFIVLMPETHLDGAEILSERIQSTIKNLKIDSTNGSPCISISCGCAELDTEKDSTFEDLINRADQGLYSQKKIKK
jgi:diguanylate cyclase (GGDEF)-like protein